MKLSEYNAKWEKYRFSDFFHRVEGKKRHEQFPNTIINEYYKRTSEQSNYKILRDVIDDTRLSRRVEIPRSDCGVVHLRTGDVINNSEFTVEQFLSNFRYYQYNHEKDEYKKQEWNSYVKPISYYATVLSKLKQLNITNVSFSYNLDWNPYTTSKTRKIYHRSYSNKKSIEYVQKICDFFIMNSFNILTYECKDMDYDFIYMCNSNVFVPSGGGLSETISNVVKLNGGIVVSGSN